MVIKMDNETLVCILFEAAEKYGNHAAIKYICDGTIREKSFCEVKEDALLVDRFLNGKDSLDAHIGILCPNSYSWVKAFWGISVSGRVFVPLNPNLPTRELARELIFADVSLVLYCSECRTIVEDLKKLEINSRFYDIDTITYDGDNEQYPSEKDITVRSSQLCGIVFTSGTSGVPKAVMLTNRNMADNARAVDMELPVGTPFFNVLPAYHLFGITADFLRGMVFGYTICINDKIERLEQNMALFKPVAAYSVPMIIHTLIRKMRMLRKKGNDMVTIKNKIFGEDFKYLGCGGAAIKQEVADAYKEWGILCLAGYGMTECSPCIASSTLKEFRPSSVGKPIKNCEVKIVDDEIWVKSPSVMIGYYKNEEETRKSFEGTWLKTGDIGYIDDDGFLYVTGRKKNLIVLSSGENIVPETIEDQILVYPEIKEVYITEKDDRLIAHIYPDPLCFKNAGANDVLERINAVIEGYNADQAAMHQILEVDISQTEFPKSATGKIKR